MMHAPCQYCGALSGERHDWSKHPGNAVADPSWWPKEWLEGFHSRDAYIAALHGEIDRLSARNREGVEK